MTGRFCVLLSILVHGVVSAVPTLQTVSPAIIDMPSNIAFSIVGTELDRLSAVSIGKPGVAPVSLTIESQTATQIVFSGDFDSAAVGLYSIEFLVDGSTPGTFPNAVEFTSSGARLIDGTRTAGTGLPIYTGATKSNAEILITASEIGRSGTLRGLRFFPTTGAIDPGGTMIVRLKETSAASFPNDMLDASGWSVVYTGPPPAPTAGEPWTIPFTATFAYGGTENLVLSIVLEGATPLGGPYLTSFEAGADRLRAGYYNFEDDPETWSGSTPPFRTLRTELPAVSLVFGGLPTVARFGASDTMPSVGDSVTFTSTSTGGATGWKWDFDYDGTVDSTLENPTYNYPSPGVYSVSLVVENDVSSDSETKLDYITVSPPASVEEWLDIRD